MKSDFKSSSSTTSNGIEILPVRAEDYIPKVIPPYVPQNNELKLIEAHFENGLPLLLVGPKGCGKTLAFAYFAFQHKTPIIQFDCSENTKRFDLIGRFILQGNEVKYLLGALPTAIEIANQSGACVLVLEELNALSPAQQKVLNQLLDWRKHVYIPEIGKTYELKNGAKLMICATMNPSTYGGTFELNEDLKSRFIQYYLPYPDERKEKEIIRINVNCNNTQLLDALLTLAKETRAGVSKGELSYALSPRDLVYALQQYESYVKLLPEADALKLLIKTIADKYEDASERKTIMERIRSILPLPAEGTEKEEEE